MTGISTKSTYGIVILMELTKYYKKKLVQINEIAKERQIPKSYLIQLLNKLKNTHLIDSVRGNKGGYKLAMHPSQLTLLDAIEKLEGNIDYFNKYQNNDAVKNIFKVIDSNIREQLKVSFEEIMTEQQKLDKLYVYNI